MTVDSVEDGVGGGVPLCGLFEREDGPVMRNF
jgi:hypothetical protein